MQGEGYLEDDVVGEHVFDASNVVFRLTFGQLDRKLRRLKQRSEVGQGWHGRQLFCNETAEHCDMYGINLVSKEEALRQPA